MFPLLGTERARQDIAEAFVQFDLAANLAKLVGMRVLPLRSVELAHGTYPVVPLKQLMKNPDSAAANPIGYAARRAPRSAYLRDDLAFTQAPYTTEEHGLEGTVDENEAAHYRSHFDHETTTAEWTRHRLLIQHELRVASACFDTTRFAPGAGGQSADAGTYDGGAARPWSDYVNAVPVSDVFGSKTKVWQKFGVYPDTMVCNEESWRHLRRCEQIREEVIAQGAGNPASQRELSVAQVAMVLDLDEIIVGAATMDANNSNDSDFQAQHCWGNGALVFKRINGGNIREIGLGHTFHWAADRSMPNGFVEDYYEPQTRTQVIRVRHQTRELIKYDIGELITNTYA